MNMMISQKYSEVTSLEMTIVLMLMSTFFPNLDVKKLMGNYKPELMGDIE